MAWGEEQDQAAEFHFQGEQDLGAEFQFQEDQDALRSILENKGIGRAQVRYLLKVLLALFHFCGFRLIGSIVPDLYQDHFLREWAISYENKIMLTFLRLPVELLISVRSLQSREKTLLMRT